MSKKAIQCTKRYDMFERHSSENRPVSEKNHRGLLDSMKRHGFLQEFPIVVVRDKRGKLIVKDGQHRLAFAEMLGLPVYWVEATNDFDIAIVNSAAKPWVLRDFAQKHAANGNQDYINAIAFADRYRMPVGVAFGLLAGTASATNCKEDLVSGKWKPKDEEYAQRVASLYSQTIGLSASVRTSRFLEACMAVCRVAEFDEQRFLQNAKRCREKLVSYSTREAYLDMMEDVYNFGRSKLFGLRAAAVTVMRERNATTAAALKKKQSAA